PTICQALILSSLRCDKLSSLHPCPTRRSSDLNYKDLHEMGFLGLCVPERLGGLGADYRTYMLVASRISYYCSNTANTFNMHNAKDRKSTRLNSSHVKISYAVFCLKKKKLM